MTLAMSLWKRTSEDVELSDQEFQRRHTDDLIHTWFGAKLLMQLIDDYATDVHVRNEYHSTVAMDEQLVRQLLTFVQSGDSDDDLRELLVADFALTPDEFVKDTSQVLRGVLSELLKQYEPLTRVTFYLEVER